MRQYIVAGPAYSVFCTIEEISMWEYNNSFDFPAAKNPGGAIYGPDSMVIRLADKKIRPHQNTS